MDKIYSESYKNLVIRDRYFLLVDNRNFRKFCTVNMKKMRLGRKEVVVEFFTGKKLNTFWEVLDDKGTKFSQITSQEFFNERK